MSQRTAKDGPAPTVSTGALLDSPLWAYPRDHRIAWWGGQGGSLGFVDFDERMSVSFVMNRWLKGPYECLRQGRILAAVYESLARH